MLHPFSYLAPRKKSELIRVLRDEGGQARLLAGGTDLLAELRFANTAPRWILDIKKIPEFDDIRFDEKEGLSIGPKVTCAGLLENPLVREKYPLLVTAAGKLGSPQLRNRATPIGNLCTASPCADMAAAFLAMGAAVEIESSRGVRKVNVEEFFVGVKKTVLERDEVILRVIVPAEMAYANGGMEKLKRIKGHDLALASVVLVKHNGLLRVSIGSCAPTPVVLPKLPVDAPPELVVEKAGEVICPIDDVRASAEYRTFMVGVFIERLMNRVKPSVRQ